MVKDDIEKEKKENKNHPNSLNHLSDHCMCMGWDQPQRRQTQTQNALDNSKTQAK